MYRGRCAATDAKHIIDIGDTITYNLAIYTMRSNLTLCLVSGFRPAMQATRCCFSTQRHCTADRFSSHADTSFEPAERERMYRYCH